MANKIVLLLFTDFKCWSQESLIEHSTTINLKIPISKYIILDIDELVNSFIKCSNLKKENVINTKIKAGVIIQINFITTLFRYVLPIGKRRFFNFRKLFFNKIINV